jgi:excisionase family DNA binding protein
MTALLTTQEAADTLRVSRRHVERLIHGEVEGAPPLPHVPVGRRLLIRKEALEAYISRLEQSTAPVKSAA